MKIGTLCVALALAAAAAGCVAGMSRMMTYGNELSDAKVRVGHRVFSIYVHPTDTTLLVQRGVAAAMGQGAVEGATFGATNLMSPMPIWRAAAQAVLDNAGTGCTVSEVYTLDNKTTWEARYTCPNGKRLSDELVREKRPAWRGGLMVNSPL